MLHRFERIRQFNNAELHPYPSQDNPCKVAPSVGVMLYALPVGGVNIWSIGRGIPWGTSCHIMAHTTDWVVYLACRSFSHSGKLCILFPNGSGAAAADNATSLAGVPPLCP